MCVTIVTAFATVAALDAVLTRTQAVRLRTAAAMRAPLSAVPSGNNAAQ